MTQNSIFLYFLLIGSILNAQQFNRIEKLIDFNNHNNNGIAVADFDNDLDLDIFIVSIDDNLTSNTDVKSKLFRNENNGAFKDITIESGIQNILFNRPRSKTTGNGLAGTNYGVSWGDYNNDNYPDLFLTGAGKITLLKNNTDGTFKDATAESGIGNFNEVCVYASPTWFDVNNDGFLDIYICEWNTCQSGNPFFINNGNGTFNDATEQFSDNKAKPSYQAFPFDFNSDGFLDLLVSQDFEIANSVFINNNGSMFSDMALEYNLIGEKNSDMGIAISDYDNDGDFDFFITNTTEANEFLENNGSNSFKNIAREKKVIDTGWSWDVTFSDFDLDGDEDLFIVSGFTQSANQSEPNFYFKNNSGNFEDITKQLRLNEIGVSVSCIPFDYDNDGDLDLIVTNSDRAAFFYENKIIDSKIDKATGWLKIWLESTTSNKNAVGSIITLETEKSTQKRYHTGLGFLSQSIKPVHFGLNNANEIKKITIKWPSGIEENFTANLNINTTIKIKEGEGVSTLNITPSVKIVGCTDPRSCNYNPDAVSDDASCIYLTAEVIIGNKKADFFSKEIYSYKPTIEGSNINWNVAGGKIVSGQGTNSIIVEWGVSTEAKVSLIESSKICSTEQILLPIELKYTFKENEKSLARLWNEALLIAIRSDFARPTIHARNLFHTSIALYDAWAIYDDEASPYLLGNNVYGFESKFDGFEFPKLSKQDFRAKTMSYAAYRLLTHRFKNSPNSKKTLKLFDFLMEAMGYDKEVTSTKYEEGNSVFLGNYIAQNIINYGLQDGSREKTAYDNAFYTSVNTPLDLKSTTNNLLENPNRWQPLKFDVFVDQSGNPTQGIIPDFLNPEWGNVNSFALTDDVKTTKKRNGHTFTFFHNPGKPPLLDQGNSTSSDNYKQTFSLVSIWSSHLDPTDGVIWDISPKSSGNNEIINYPNNFENYANFYNREQGGDVGKGRTINPKTNLPYKEQMVPRGDFTRVLAEFWADGPDSETPPGHWYTILNKVNDHPLLLRKFEGNGDELNLLEWDVKSYFLLGGALHDAAVATWSVKGWYDYVRPISALRNMALLGQSTDTSLQNYNENGIPLQKDYIEIIEDGDPLEGADKKNVGKIKLFAWKGTNTISNPNIDTAGVDWILAEKWVPYQRPSFVTPPFAGYVSGHSAFSRAAAEVLTLFTGDDYFPGGMGEFYAKKNEFLVFEEGPSVDVTLQWATYRDAADQSGLSRIWGGIHPPADDIPGRIIGEKVGIAAYNFGITYFKGKKTKPTVINNEISVYPNPFVNNVFLSNTEKVQKIQIFDLKGANYSIPVLNYNQDSKVSELNLSELSTGIYIVKVDNQYHKVIKL